MITWDEGVAALHGASDLEEVEPGRWRPGLPRVPIVITGSSGAGKTEIWRRLTGRRARDAPSTRVDQGYIFRSPIAARKRTRVAVTTIPGQTSKERYSDLGFYFSARARLKGVVFVASFGFDHVWPDETDVVANQLETFTIEALSQRNVDQELASFRETCEHLRRRHYSDRNLAVPWLLVLVNKADLFFAGIDRARDYYLPGSGSDFDREAERLTNDVGAAAGFRYAVLPVAMRPRDYVIRSNRGTLVSATQLTQPQANASIQLMIRAVESLSHD